MSADVRAMKTPAEQALSSAFAATRCKLPGKGAVVALRDDAFRRFDASGLPHRRIEEWKYTDLRALMREAKPLAEPVGSKGVVPALSGVEASRIAIVNGRYEPGWSNIDDPGIVLSELFAFAGEETDYRLGNAPGKDDIAVSLNTAFMTGGVALRIKKGARVSKPLQLAHIFSGAAAATYPRCIVVVEKGAQLTLIESFDGPSGADYQVNSVLELVIGEGAQVDHVKVGSDGDAALRISTLGVTVDAKTNYRDFAFTTGGAVVRNQTFVRFVREGTEASISGATLIKGRQHVDNTLVIEHAAGAAPVANDSGRCSMGKATVFFRARSSSSRTRRRPTQRWRAMRCCSRTKPKPTTSRSSKSSPTTCNAGTAQRLAPSIVRSSFT